MNSNNFNNSLSTYFNRTFSNFINLNFNKKNANFFLENSSFMVDQLFEKVERNHTNSYSISSYELASITVLILMGAEISFNSKNIIGEAQFNKQEFQNSTDFLSPGIIEYDINKRNTASISFKSVSDIHSLIIQQQDSRISLQEYFLVTLSKSISDEHIKLLKLNGATVVTTSTIKKNNYFNSNVITFEEMIDEIKIKSLAWESVPLSIDQKQKKIELLKKHLQSYEDHEFIRNYFHTQLNDLGQEYPIDKHST